MLSEREKKEFVKDGSSLKRRNDFSMAKLKAQHIPSSLDEYIRFLNEMQQIFGPFACSKKKTVTTFNKL